MERHRFDPVSFVFGALFALVGLLGVVPAASIGIADLRWIAPGGLVLLGLVLVLSAAVNRGRRPDDLDRTEADADREPATIGAHATAERSSSASTDPRDEVGRWDDPDTTDDLGGDPFEPGATGRTGPSDVPSDGDADDGDADGAGSADR